MPTAKWGMIGSAATVVAALIASFVAPTQAAQPNDPPGNPCDDDAVLIPTSGFERRTATTICGTIIPSTLADDPCTAEWRVTEVNGTLQWKLSGDAPPDTYSACWYDIGLLYSVGCESPDERASPQLDLSYSTGFPLNINLLANPSIGSFLPPSPTLQGSSVALLAAGDAAQSTGWMGLERPTHAGVVDLVTGAPLARFSELELPFGGSTFRLVRTRSHSQRMERHDYSCTSIKIIDDWWDWAGNGWMISESPLLLIDSAVPDIVGDGPRTTFLILDAHHAIPFQRMDDDGRYEAPARFRASLTHNGAEWKAATASWETAPTQYHVSLYDGALTYSFLVVREDIPDNLWTPPPGVSCDSQPCRASFHDRPILPQQVSGAGTPTNASFNPGQGVPYYGLCYKIEDRQGNIVDIELAGVRQHNIDNPQSTVPSDTEPDPDPCVECTQQCPGKGQIRVIRLRKPTASGTSVEWTLVYRYRIAPRWLWDQSEDAEPSCLNNGNLFNWQLQLESLFDYFGRRTLHSITVFRGEPAALQAFLLQPSHATADFFTLSSEVRQYSGTPSVDCLDGDIAPLPSTLRDLWTYQVRYSYDFQRDLPGVLGTLHNGMLHELPKLMKVESQSRAESQGLPDPLRVQSQEWVFAYEHTPQNTIGSASDYWLTAIFDPAAVGRAIDLARSMNPPVAMSASHLAFALNPNTGGPPVPGVPQVSDAIRDTATVQWLPWPNSGLTDASVLQGLFGSPGRPYIRTGTATVTPFESGQTAQVGACIITNDQGVPRYFRLFRFAAGEDTQPASPSGFLPHRTAYHPPYTWRGWDAQSVRYTPPAYTEPRWITFVDEVEERQFASSGHLLPHKNYTVDTTRARRIVHVSASGVLLRDDSWTYNADGSIDVASSGLGAERVYCTAAEYLKATSQIELPPPPGRGQSPDGFNLQGSDQFASIRNEMLLLEQRSVGWSVADADSRGDTAGLVQFFEYELRKYDSDLKSSGEPVEGAPEGWLTDTTVTLDVKASGVKEGEAHSRNSNELEIRDPPEHPRIYSNETIRIDNPAAPEPPPETWAALDDRLQWEFEVDIEYLVPTLAAGRVTLATLPVPGSEPLLTDSPPYEPRAGITYRLTKRKPNETNENSPAFERQVLATLTIGPGRQQKPGGAWFFPVERTEFDSEGKQVRTISGLVCKPLRPGDLDHSAEPAQSLSHTAHIYDSEGRQRHIIVDAPVNLSGQLPDPYPNLTGRPPELQVSSTDVSTFNTSESFPDGWGRMDAGAVQQDPRNYVTTFQYGNDSRLTDIYYPNGRRWASRVVIIACDEDFDSDGDLNWNLPSAGQYSSIYADHVLERADWYAREYVFNEIEHDDSEHLSRMVGEVRDYPSIYVRGRPSVTRRVYYATETQHPDIENPTELTGFLTNPTTEAQPRFIEEQKVRYILDSAGRYIQADLSERGPNGAIIEVGSKKTYDLVDVLGEYAFDGTITRTTRNALGQSMRRYVGTREVESELWTTYLALTERYEYGQGIQDAWLPTITRRYTFNPSWAQDAYGATASPDDDGYATRTAYDWRMRPVRVDEFGESETGSRDPAYAPSLTTTLTYLDNAGRPIIVASFGAGAAAMTLDPELDPVLRREWLHASRIDVTQLYALPVRPNSVVENFYGPDGNVVRKLTYHYHIASGQVTAHEEHTYTGRLNQEVYRLSPQQPVTLTDVDGLGRMTSSQQVVPNASGALERQLARTDYLLDADGNIRGTSQFERALDTGDELDALTTPNAVRRRSLSWYDPQKRVTASAELGSESCGLDDTGPHAMIAAPVAYTPGIDTGDIGPNIKKEGSNDPEVLRDGVPEWAALTVNRYSILTGRLIWTANPDGSITEFSYDRAGRLARRTENAYPGVDRSRSTEYEYTLGRLTGIKAQRTDGPAPAWQTTRIAYGAAILAEQPGQNGEPPSYAPSGVHHASWVGRMHLPVPSTGAPSYTPLDPLEPPHEDDFLDTGEIILRYTFKGQIAERTDARGVVFRYFYDALDRLRWVLVGSYDAQSTFTYQLPASMGDSNLPVDRVMSVEYRYNDQGRLSDIIARGKADDPDTTITHTRYEYDERGNLTREWQASGDELDATPPADTPRIDYVWSYAPTDTQPASLTPGHDRLASMTYPLPPGGTEAERRVVLFDYGSSGGVDNFLSRIAAIRSGHGGIDFPVAAFTYAGVSTRAAMTLGSGSSAITADLRASDGLSGVGLPGLDMFGRLRDLHFRNAAAPPRTLFRAQHGYDESGNRLYDRVTQAEASGLHNGSSHILDARSQLHAYDSLQRLTQSTVGRLDQFNQIEAASQLRRDQWWLDLLGNWNNDPGEPSGSMDSGRHAQGNLDGFVPPQAVALAGGTSAWGSFQPWQDGAAPATSTEDDLHTVQLTDGRNEVAVAHVRTATTGAFDKVYTRYDRAGNLAFDGTFIYQFDAWGRLVQVNAGAADPAVTPMPENPYYGLVFGPMLKHYTFDGLGRLVRTQSPFPTPQLAQNGEVRSERFYYDGIRRIQEVRTDPTMSLMMAMGSGDPEAQTLGETALQNAQEAAGGPGVTVETSAATMELEGGLQELNGGPGNEPMGGPVLAREYIWGPGDAWHATPVDELLVYYGEGRVAYWPLQDAGGDVVAVCAQGGSAEGYQARVAAQQRYDAYGQVISADHIHPHAFLSVGHKGLFYDRLDRGVADDTATGAAIPPNAPAFSGYETPQVVPFSRGTYHVRNRTYIPGGGSPQLIGQAALTPTGPPGSEWSTVTLSQQGLSSGATVHGRWMQADPNAMGVVLTQSAVFMGLTFQNPVANFDLERASQEGMNRYQYLRSNCVDSCDELGLYTAAEGYAVEAAVQALYRADHPGHTIKCGKWVYGVPLKPDIVNYTTDKWIEVKPLSPRGIIGAGLQGGKYLTNLALFSITPDAGWVPSSSHVLALGKRYAITNMGGIVFYATWDANTEDATVLFGGVAAFSLGQNALAANALELGSTAVGRMVLGLLGGSTQALGLAPGTLAGASVGSIEMGTATVTMRQTATRSWWF